MPDPARERRVIEGFCCRLIQIENKEVRVLRWPDSEEPGQGRCDAIVSRGGIECVVEHTTVQSFKNQRRDEAKGTLFFDLIVPVVEKQCAGWWVEVTLPDAAIRAKADRVGLAGAIARAVVAEVHNASDKRSAQNCWVPGLSEQIEVSCDPVTSGHRCILKRRILHERMKELECVLERLIPKKNEQLMRCGQGGLSTVLLLDFDDYQSLSEDILAEAYSNVRRKGLPVDIDEIYLAKSYLDPIWIRPLKLRERSYPQMEEYTRFFEIQFDIDTMSRSDRA